MKRRGFTPASAAQRSKVRQAFGCRVCGWNGGTEPPSLDPMHITDRALGGCDHEDCVVEACRPCHRLYDQGQLDVLPVLTKAEQAHAVAHSGMVSALQQVTGDRWAPCHA